MNSQIAQKYCRFCAQLKMDDELLDLEVFPYLNAAIQEKLSALNVGSDIDMSSRDRLPKTVCSSCRNALVQAHEFVMKLRSSQYTLKMMYLAKLDEVKVENQQVYVEVIDGKLESDDTLLIKEEHEGLKEELKEDSFVKSETGNKCDTITVEFVPIENDSVAGEESIKSANNMGDLLVGQVVQPNETSDILTVTRDVSWTSYKCSCRDCDETLPNINALREHCKEVHDNLCCGYKCADCKLMFKSFETFTKHAILHREQLRTYCPYCNIHLESSDSVNHIDDHRSRDSICDRCGKIFDSKDYLEQHKRDNDYNWDNIFETRTRKRKKEARPKVLSSSKLQSIEDESWNGYPWTCQMCDHEFGGLLLLRAHIKEVHGKCFAMKCVDCVVVMECYREFAHHVRKHRRFLKQYCHYCNHAFKEGELEWEHISQHFAEEYRVCEGCGEILPDTQTYLQHVSLYQPPKSRKRPLETFRESKGGACIAPTPKRDFKCDICQKVLSNIFVLRQHHINMHTKRRKEEGAMCDKCGKTFYDQNTLKYHLSTHEEVKEKPEICKICNRGFKTVALLKKHVETHTGLKPIQCDVCQRRFRTKNAMAGHFQGVHVDQKTVKCPVCDKKFKCMKYLKKHELQHTGEKRYKCSDCGRQFTHWPNCDKHMRRMHGTTLAKSTYTPRGKLPLGFKTEQVDSFKDWTEEILKVNK